MATPISPKPASPQDSDQTPPPPVRPIFRDWAAI